MNRPSQTYYTTCAIVVPVVIIVASALFIMISYSYHTSIINNPYLTPKRLPKRYSISNKYDTPAKDCTNHSTNWVYALTSFLESSYKNQGISTGHLSNDEFVEFSEEGFITSIHKKCNEDKNNLICKKYGTPFSANDGSIAYVIALFKNIKNISKSIIPASFCLNSKCSSTSDIVNNVESKNAINFEIKSTNYASNVETIKQLLVSSKRPLLFSLPSMKAKYLLPCSDSRVSFSTRCASKSIPCNFGNCDYIETSTIMNNGDFIIPNDPALTALGPPNNFVLVGYNDDFVVSRGTTRFSSQIFSKGGFIVRGYKGWKYGGSIAYHEGETVFEADRKICPSFLDPSNWRNNLTNETYDLDCIDSSRCNTKKKYILCNISDVLNIHEDTFGLTSTKLIEIGDKDQGNKTIIIDDVHFWDLNKVFKPSSDVEKRFKTNSICGYWFIPYGYVDLAISKSSNGAPVVAVDMRIKWSRESYANSIQGETYNIIRNSTHKINRDGNRFTEPLL